MQDQLLGLDRPTVTIYNYPGHSYPDYDQSSCTSTSCEQSLNAAGVAQSKFYTDALDTLMSNAAGAPWYDNNGNNGGDLTAYNNMVSGVTDYSNPRVLNLIVTDLSDAQNGNSYMPVRAFVPVYLMGYSEDDDSGGGSSGGNGKGNGKGNSGNSGTDLKVTFLFLPTQSNLDPNLETSSGGKSGIALLY